MILVMGIPSEPPLADVLGALSERRADVVVLNQRLFAECDLAFSVDPDGRVDGLLRMDRRHWRLSEVTGVYVRLMDYRELPELRQVPPGDPRWSHCRALHDALMAWTDIVPGRVVNRAGPMASNASKPFQAQVIARHGFLVPETLVTNDPAAAREFYERHERVVYKSISGVRSVVQTMGAADLDRLERLRLCPVQFQAYVPGVDVRVHTVGDAVFATEVASAATDYRYATTQVSEPARLSETTLPHDVAAQCVELAAALGLEFAGVDLKVTPDDEVYCFEVNPSPAYSYFESHTGQPIAAALAAHLDS